MSDSASREADETPATSDSLRLRLETPERVTAGEAVPMTLRAENVTDGPVELHLRGREIVFDLVVTRSDGTVAWRRLEGEVVPAILRLETLPAGEALVLEATWDQRANDGSPVAPGVYTVRGELLTEAEPLVTPTDTLRIVSGD